MTDDQPDRSECAACGEPVSYTDEGGCVGTDPAYHFNASCLVEAARREHAAVERLRRLLAHFRLDDSEFIDEYEGGEPSDDISIGVAQSRALAAEIRDALDGTEQR